MDAIRRRLYGVGNKMREDKVGRLGARTWKGHAARDEASRVKRNAFVKGKTMAVSGVK